MPSRLALVHSKSNTDGPWTIAKGNESKVEIFGLGQGEGVRLELETSRVLRSLGISVLAFIPGPTSKSFDTGFVSL